MSPAARKPFHRGLDRATVLRAALAVLDDDGRQALTMRQVAARLDVEAASLYSHVSSKDDLVDGVLDLVLDAVELPSPGADWRAELVAGYTAYRTTLVAHPSVITLMNERSRQSGAQARLVSRSIELLESSGLSTETAVLAHVTLIAYTLGFVLQEVAAPSRLPDDVLADSPVFQRAVPALLRHTVDERFRTGLQTILDGIPRP